MDSFDMPPATRVKLRLKRLNPETLDPGQFVIVCARAMGQGFDAATGKPAHSIVQFPAVLEVCLDDGQWHAVEVVNGFEE